MSMTKLFKSGMLAPFIPSFLASGWKRGSSELFFRLLIITSQFQLYMIITEITLQFALVGDTTERSTVWFTFAASTTSRIPERQAKNPVFCAIDESRYPGSSQVPVSRQDIFPFLSSRTICWSVPGSRRYPSRPCYQSGISLNLRTVVTSRSYCSQGKWLIDFQNNQSSLFEALRHISKIKIYKY